MTSFFQQVPQLHRPYQRAPFALGDTPTTSQIAMRRKCGMERTFFVDGTKGSVSSTGTEQYCAPAGNESEDATVHPTHKVTSAPDVVQPHMVPKVANEPNHQFPGVATCYNPDTWRRHLSSHNLLTEYAEIPESLQNGFNAGIPIVTQTFTPPNHSSVSLYSTHFNSIVNDELTKGRYLGPLSRSEVEQIVGPFQSSPLSIIPKPGKPGKFRLIQNLSFPHSPRNGISSINSAIDSSLFPCTWGTFATISFIIFNLPTNSQAAVHDVKEAYRTIPVRPSQWAGLVVRLEGSDRFAIDTRNCFGLASSGGIYGRIGDAGAQLFRANGIGPVSKWVDDHVFFRIPRKHLEDYNRKRSGWATEIQKNGGKHHKGGRIWYQGNAMPDGNPSEFDEDMSSIMRDLSSKSTRSNTNMDYTYCMADIDALGEELGIPWEHSKDIDFAQIFPYIGFSWNLENKTVSIPAAKKQKYLVAIKDWKEQPTHTLAEVQKLYGKLLHACSVIPAGRAYLTTLERFMANFNNSPFMPRTPPRATATDLKWWERTLSQPSISRAIRIPNPILDSAAYSDASLEVGIGITIGDQWRAWRLLPGWKADGRDIGWAEAVGFLFLVTTLSENAQQNSHIKVYGDNRGVVEGWWKGRSRNPPTNDIFKLIHVISETVGALFLTEYVSTAHNPADKPSRGKYYSPTLLLPIIPIPIPL